jgi:hypothetical protein
MAVHDALELAGGLSEVSGTCQDLGVAGSQLGVLGLEALQALEVDQGPILIPQAQGALRRQGEGWFQGGLASQELIAGLAAEFELPAAKPEMGQA